MLPGGCCQYLETPKSYVFPPCNHSRESTFYILALMEIDNGLWSPIVD